MLHCANILAQWFDNNEDGLPDDPVSYSELVDRYASMLMWQNENQAENDYDLFVLDRWGQSGDGDINGSGLVDVGDILAIISAWGLCP